MKTISFRYSEKVNLFGSVARNDFNEGSDNDITIIGDFKERFLDRIGKILEILKGKVHFSSE